MIGIALFGDVWTTLLTLGIFATFATTVVMILGWTPGKGGDRKVLVRQVRRVEQPVPWRVSTATAVRERAAASARAKAAASVRERGLLLTDVRVVDQPASEPGDGLAGEPSTAEAYAFVPADLGEHPDSPAETGEPAGREPGDVDRLRARFDAVVTPDEAHAIATEVAQQQPNRAAEVITEWIRSDLKNKARRSH